jgi:protein involved in polysaccharide export with SLBB domain
VSFLVVLGLVAGITPAAAQSRSRSLRFQDVPVGEATDIQQQLEEEKLRQRSMASTALAGPVDPEQYLVGPGDVLMLEYTGPAAMAMSVTVDGEGRLRIPNLGTVSAAGRTLADLREEILTELQPFVPKAKIDLRLVAPRLFKVFVVGAVEDAGIAEVRGSARVIEALDAVGGLQENASTRNIRVMHADGSEQIADLQRFFWTGDWSANPYLVDGDRIVVPIETKRVLVTGAVAQPGAIEYREGDTLANLIEVAGGTVSEARLDSVLLIRFRGYHELDTLVVDLATVHDGTAPDIDIHEDDRVFVRAKPQWHLSRLVTIEGEVKFPGTYAVIEGQDRISDLIAWAGGFTEEASLKAVRLLRRPEIDGQDVEFDRLSRLTRAEMTESEYQTFRGKLAIRQSAYLVDFSTGAPEPPESDILLQDGDIIQVERLELAVRVDGSVLRPGFIIYEDDLTVSDYIERAGGTIARADLGKTRITRAGSNESQLANSGWLVEPGDFIWVPEKKDTSFWDTFKDVIAVAGQMAAIILLLDTVSRNN